MTELFLLIITLASSAAKPSMFSLYGIFAASTALARVPKSQLAVRQEEEA